MGELPVPLCPSIWVLLPIFLCFSSSPVMMDGLGGDQLGYRRLRLCLLLVSHRSEMSIMVTKQPWPGWERETRPDQRSTQLLSFEGLAWLSQYRIITA